MSTPAPSYGTLSTSDPKFLIHYVCVARGTVILARHRPNKKLGERIAPDFKKDLLGLLGRVELEGRADARESIDYPTASIALTIHYRKAEGVVFLCVASAVAQVSPVHLFLGKLSTQFRASFGGASDVADVKKLKLPSAFKTNVIVPETQLLNEGFRDSGVGTTTRAGQLRDRAYEIGAQTLAVKQDLEARGDHLENLDNETNRLLDASEELEHNATKLKRKMCWRDKKCWVLSACAAFFILVLFAYIIYGAITSNWTFSSDQSGQNGTHQ